MAASSRVSCVIGWVLSVLVSALLTLSGSMKFNFNEEMLAEWTKMYPASAAPILGGIELACMVLYLIPRTSVLGGMLLLAYLGGAVSSHVASQDGMWFSPVVIGVLMWLGLSLREPRLWQLAPIRSRAESASPPS